MNKIKTPNVAGKFYTSLENELKKTIEYFKDNHKTDYNYESRAIIVPHAGYNFSGQLAFDGFSYLDKNAKNIFILAPTHQKTINNLALSSYDEFETPLGRLSVNQKIQNEIIELFECEYCDAAFENEHAIEVQLPFIQTFFANKDIKIIPILIGNDDIHKTIKIIKHYYVNPKNVFVISSDLTHFLPEEQQIQQDIMTAKMIEDKMLQGFRFEQACGAVPICALAEYALEKSFSLIRVGMSNSAKLTGDTSSVVGYGSWFLYEGERNQFIAENFAPKLTNIIRKTIEEKLKGKSEINITSYMPYPPVLDSYGTCFVTLELNDQLRGCVGSVLPHCPLLIDLIKNGYNAAFQDNRFKPLTTEEFDKVKISISLLGPLEPMTFSDEQDLLKQIRPNIDGLVIRDKNKQALYLPSVWEQLPNRKHFLNSLKKKAGFTPDYFSKTFEVYRFTTEYIKE